MGTYRFILAAFVMYSHAFGTIFGINPGVAAVISFFVISGYVMSILIERTYPSLADIPGFYLDRAMRLFPQYLFYLTITLLLVSIMGLSDPFFSDRQPLHILANFLILPIGYYMFGLDHALYIPPAWSLGLETTFYLVFPFFCLLPNVGKSIAVVGSLMVFAAAYSGLVNTDWFGYRLLPGTFFIFLAGAALAGSKMPRIYAYVICIAMTVAFGALFMLPSEMSWSFNVEVTLGAAIGIFFVALVRKIPRTIWDDYLGNLSYGFFLSHFLFIFIADHYGISRWPFVPVGAIIAAAVSYELVEKPALHLRQKWRHAKRRMLTVSMQP